MLTGHPFIIATNNYKFKAQGSLDVRVEASASLRALAVAFMKRLLSFAAIMVDNSIKFAIPLIIRNAAYIFVCK